MKFSSAICGAGAFVLIYAPAIIFAGNSGPVARVGVFSWTPVRAATGYILTRNGGDIGATAKTQLTYRGIQRGDVYTVRATNAAAVSLPSSPLRIP